MGKIYNVLTSGLGVKKIVLLRLVITAVLCVAIHFTGCVTAYHSCTDVAAATSNQQQRELTGNLSTAQKPEGDGTVNDGIYGVEREEEEEEEQEDNGDDAEEFLFAKAEEEHTETTEAAEAAETTEAKPQEDCDKPPRIKRLLVFLLLLFEPFPQIALLTLTKSGTACSLSIIASLVHPELAALFFGFQRGYLRHHTVLYVLSVIAVLTRTLYGSLTPLFTIPFRLLLSEEEWEELQKYQEQLRRENQKKREKALKKKKGISEKDSDEDDEDQSEDDSEKDSDEDSDDDSDDDDYFGKGGIILVPVDECDDIIGYYEEDEGEEEEEEEENNNNNNPDDVD